MSDVWSEKWLDKTLQSFIVPNEPEWDRCDNCFAPTHIKIAKWVILNESTRLICKHCQKKFEEV